MKFLNYYDQFKDKIFSYFYYNLNKDNELAEDLTSETFLKWFEKFDTYNNDFQFSTWIFTIARNTLKDYYRKQKIDISLDDKTEISYSEFIKYEEDFHSNINNKVILHKTKIALNNLKTEHKDIIIMKYLSEFSTKEISKITWKTEANIRKIISRGLKVLLEILNSKNISYE